MKKECCYQLIMEEDLMHAFVSFPSELCASCFYDAAILMWKTIKVDVGTFNFLSYDNGMNKVWYYKDANHPGVTCIVTEGHKKEALDNLIGNGCSLYSSTSLEGRLLTYNEEKDCWDSIVESWNED
jgi:hypothetical protein